MYLKTFSFNSVIFVLFLQTLSSCSHGYYHHGETQFSNKYMDAITICVWSEGLLNSCKCSIQASQNLTDSLQNLTDSLQNLTDSLQNVTDSSWYSCCDLLGTGVYNLSVSDMYGSVFTIIWDNIYCLLKRKGELRLDSSPCYVITVVIHKPESNVTITNKTCANEKNYNKQSLTILKMAYSNVTTLNLPEESKQNYAVIMKEKRYIKYIRTVRDYKYIKSSLTFIKCAFSIRKCELKLTIFSPSYFVNCSKFISDVFVILKRMLQNYKDIRIKCFLIIYNLKNKMYLCECRYPKDCRNSKDSDLCKNNKTSMFHEYNQVLRIKRSSSSTIDLKIDRHKPPDQNNEHSEPALNASSYTTLADHYHHTTQQEDIQTATMKPISMSFYIF